MARRLMVMLALAATSAQAQDAAKATEGNKGAALPKAKQHATILAARSANGPPTSPLSQSSGPRDGGLDAGSVTGEGPWDKFAVCALPVALLGTEAPVVRTYPAPPPLGTGTSTDGWKQAPYVRAIGRCGPLYILQIWSRSKDRWAIEHARVEGPDGETLHVNAFRSKRMAWEWDATVIVAEIPPGGNISKLKLTLTGDDGRAALIEARDLP